MAPSMITTATTRRRTARAGFAIAALALVAAACSDDSGLAGQTSTPTTTSPTATTSTAPPTTSPDDEGSSTTVPPAPGVELPPLLENADGAHDDLTGVGRLTGQGSDCTAFLVDTGAAAAPAHALTNGHCVGLFDSRTVIVDGPGGGTVAFNRFVDTDSLDVPVASVRWATMRGVDLAVLELDATLGELEEQGVAAYALRPFALEGSELRIVGVPVTGVDPDEYFLRAASCSAATTSRLVEFTWVWDAAQANDCDAIVGGNSGSPVFDASGDVVGIVNTTTVAAAPGGECYLGHPCEITADGAHMLADTSYAIPVDGISGCFTAAGAFDSAACGIEPGPSAVALSQLRPVQQSPAGWLLAIDTTAASVVGKAGPIGEVDCREPQGYAAIDVADFTPAPPVGEGFHIACVAVADGGVADTASAAFVVLQVDDTAPVVEPELSTIELGEDYSVEPIFATPELSDYDMKAGPTTSTDCADPEGYVGYRRIPMQVAAADLPAAVCVIGYDLADNATDPVRFELD